jgi:hypothetical protein
VVEAGQVGVELRVILERDEILVRHLPLEAVHLAVRETRLGQRGHVLLGIEPARRAPVLRVAGVPMRPVPAERRRQQHTRGEFFPRERPRAVRQQPHRREKE